MPFVIILTVLILFSYLAWRKSLGGVYAVIFSLPLYFWKFNLLSIPFTVPEAMIYLLALIFLIKKKQEDGGAFLKDSIKIIKQNVFINPLLFLGITLLFSGAIIATIISLDIRVSAGILKGWFFAPLLFLLIFIGVIKKTDEVRRALSALALSGSLVALAAFVYWLVPESAGVTYDERLRAFYLSANHLAMYLAPALIIVFGIWYLVFGKTDSKARRGKNSFETLPSLTPPRNKFGTISNWGRKQQYFNRNYYLLSGFLVVLIPFLLTYSYGAWLGVFAAVIFILGANCWLLNKKKSNFIFTVILLVVFAGLIFSQANADKFKNIVNFTYPSVSSRLVIWDVAGDILKEHWLLGIGPGTFRDYYLKKQTDYPPYPEWAVPQPHNIFLAFWMQTGLSGLIGFLMILVWFFKAGASILRNSSYNRNVIASFRQQADAKQSRGINSAKYLAIICLAIMIYTLVHGLVDTTYWKNDLALIFWLLIGVIYVLKKQGM